MTCFILNAPELLSLKTLLKRRIAEARALCQSLTAAKRGRTRRCRLNFKVQNSLLAIR